MVLDDLGSPEPARLLISAGYGTIDLGGFYMEEWEQVENAWNRSFDDVPDVERGEGEQ